MVSPQFALPSPVDPRAVTWRYQCPEDPGAEVDLPGVLRLSRCEISGSPTGEVVGAQAPTNGSGVVSDCIRFGALAWSAVLFGERSGWGHHRVATRPPKVDGR